MSKWSGSIQQGFPALLLIHHVQSCNDRPGKDLALQALGCDSDYSSYEEESRHSNGCKRIPLILPKDPTSYKL